MRKSGWKSDVAQLVVILVACLAGSLVVSGIVYATDERCRALGFAAAMRTVYFLATGICLLLAAARLCRRDRFADKRSHGLNASVGMKPSCALLVISAFFMVGAVVLDLYVA